MPGVAMLQTSILWAAPSIDFLCTLKCCQECLYYSAIAWSTTESEKGLTAEFSKNAMKTH